MAFYQANPLAIVQTISVFSYLDILSDYLFVENFLKENDQHKHIPIVNALTYYLYKHDNDQEKKMILAKKLLARSNYYGVAKNEALDANFVDLFFKHTISSLVFNKFHDVYGFLADTFLKSKNEDIQTLFQDIIRVLKNTKFDNEYGEFSTLETLSIIRIMEYIIIPLFPLPNEDNIVFEYHLLHSQYQLNNAENIFLKFQLPSNLSIFSVDYIYAQAGLMFLRSNQNGSSFHYLKNERNLSNLYDESIRIAHVIEYLVLAGKLDSSALRIFALPALLFHVREIKRRFQPRNILDIINDKEQWITAYHALFTYLHEIFEELEIVQKHDHRYQFFLALSNYKNRTTMAKEIILKTCPLWQVSKHENEIHAEAVKYENNPDSYKCEEEGEKKLLPNINKMFENQNANIAEKYFLYEKDSIREAFGDDFIKFLDNNLVLINTGLMGHFYAGSPAVSSESYEVVKSSDDLLKIYFTNNDTSLYYALIRDNFNITLIKEADGPQIFRKKLEMGPYTKDFNRELFPTTLKEINEKFDDFSNKIAKKRAEQLRRNLYLSGYDQTWKEWWKEIGLALIPFYTCATDIIHRQFANAFIACTMDLVFLFPGLHELADITSMIMTRVSRLFLQKVGTTLRTVAIKRYLRSLLKMESENLVNNELQILNLMDMNILKDFGKAVFHLLDPGFDLIYRIGSGGIRSIRNLISDIEKRGFQGGLRFDYFKQSQATFENVINSAPIKVDEKFGMNVYVNSVDKFSGFGYKFIFLPDNRIAEMRNVQGFEEEIPVVFDRLSDINVKIYKKVDVRTWKSTGKDLYEENNGLTEKYDSFEESLNNIERYNEESFCIQVRSKRSPGSLHCLRAERLNEKELIEEEAIIKAFTLSGGKYTEDEIRKVLRSYYFPDEYMQMKFVEHWMGPKIVKIPEWSEIYKIEEPELFFELRFKSELDSPILTIHEVEYRITSLYRPEEQQFFNSKLLLQEYSETRPYLYTTFEDYVALVTHRGSTIPMAYSILGTSSDVARRMRYALYRLTIRQMDEHINLFSPVLFRGEMQQIETFQTLFESGKEVYQLDRFISTSRYQHIAEHFHLYPKCREKDCVRILYEISFPPGIRYLRASTERVTYSKDCQTVLLPGSKFKIAKVQRFVQDGNIHAYVKLDYVETDMVEEVKKVMAEIKQLKYSGTTFNAQ